MTPAAGTRRSRNQGWAAVASRAPRALADSEPQRHGRTQRRKRRHQIHTEKNRQAQNKYAHAGKFSS